MAAMGPVRGDRKPGVYYSGMGPARGNARAGVLCPASARGLRLEMSDGGGSCFWDRSRSVLQGRGVAMRIFGVEATADREHRGLSPHLCGASTSLVGGLLRCRGS